MKTKIKGSLFNIQTGLTVLNRLRKELYFPFISASSSSRGGEENYLISLSVSKESKGNWFNGIYENSTYMRFHIYNDGTVENYLCHNCPKVRKFTVKNIDDLISRLNQY